MDSLSLRHRGNPHQTTALPSIYQVTVNNQVDVNLLPHLLPQAATT